MDHMATAMAGKTCRTCDVFHCSDLTAVRSKHPIPYLPDNGGVYFRRILLPEALALPMVTPHLQLTEPSPGKEQAAAALYGLPCDANHSTFASGELLLL